MEVDTSNRNSNNDGIISQMVKSRLTGLTGLSGAVSKGERRLVLRALKLEERREATKAVEVSQVLKSSMRSGRKPTKHLLKYSYPVLSRDW